MEILSLIDQLTIDRSNISSFWNISFRCDLISRTKNEWSWFSFYTKSDNPYVYDRHLNSGAAHWKPLSNDVKSYTNTYYWIPFGFVSKLFSKLIPIFFMFKKKKHSRNLKYCIEFLFIWNGFPFLFKNSANE